MGEGDRAGAGDERYEAAIVGKQPLRPRRRARGGGGGEAPRVKERAKAPREGIGDEPRPEQLGGVGEEQPPDGARAALPAQRDAL